MKRKRYIWLFSIFVICASGVWLYFHNFSKKAPEWKTAKVEKGSITVNVTATGSLSALKTVDVGTQISGMIAKLFVDFNSEVRKGQVIAILDTSILSTSYEEARALLQKSAIQLNESKTVFERQKKLYETGAISKAEFDLALSDYETAQSVLASSKAQLRKAKINRQYAVIRAPIQGVVISRNVDVGQTVISSLNSPILFTIANDLRKMQVYANVDEADIGLVKPGQEVSFTVDAYPGKSFSGNVKQIRLQPVVVQNVVTYIVVIDVANPDLKLLPGLTANIYFKVQEHRGILKAQTAIFQFTPPDEYLQQNIQASLIREIKKHQGRNKTNGDSAYVWVKNNNVLVPVLISIGLMENGYAEISGNIHEGDEIVVRMQTEEKTSSPRNPFMPSFRQPKRSS